MKNDVEGFRKEAHPPQKFLGVRRRRGAERKGVGLRAWVVACALGGSIAGCGGGDADGWGTESAPAVRQGKTQVWYGRANAWAAGGLDALRADVEACAAAGVSGYMIELLGWGAVTTTDDEALKETTADAYANLVSWCRSLGLWLFVSVGNDNAGFGGYGDRGVPLSTQTELLDWAIDLVRSHGAANVIVQPCAETKTATGAWLEARCAERLAGFTLVNNGNGGRPAQAASWAEFRVWHPLLGSDNPPDALIVSDSGDLIRILASDHSLDGPGDPERLRAWVHLVKANGCPVAGYYAFLHAQHDAPAIQALGEALREE